MYGNQGHKRFVCGNTKDVNNMTATDIKCQNALKHITNKTKRHT